MNNDYFYDIHKNKIKVYYLIEINAFDFFDVDCIEYTIKRMLISIL